MSLLGRELPVVVTRKSGSSPLEPLRPLLPDIQGLHWWGVIVEQLCRESGYLVARCN
jgi:hypothetical protein